MGKRHGNAGSTFWKLKQKLINRLEDASDYSDHSLGS
jgi:hypothetical protein